MLNVEANRLAKFVNSAEASYARLARRGTAGESDARNSISTSWYDELRERYRPSKLKVLFIAESPPAFNGRSPRFFYTHQLSQHDNLFRGIVTAVYGRAVLLEKKELILRRFRDDGFWLVDAVDRPVNKLHSAARRSAILLGAKDLIRRCRSLEPRDGVIICKSDLYTILCEHFRRAGIRVFHDVPLPFPLGNLRAQFVAGVRKALARFERI